jgi:hypothetical protein
MSRTRSDAQHEEWTFFLLWFILCMVVLSVAVAAATREERKRDDLRGQWSAVEDRYAVKVLDRTVLPPTHTSQAPVPVAMEVAGRTQQCDVQVVRGDRMVFCGEDAVEAPRR